MMKDSRQGH